MSSLVLRTFLQQLRQQAGAADGELGDAELLARFAATKDQAAFELLVWRHASMVLNLCRRLLRHEQDAEDAFQATFLTLARKAGTIRRSESLAGWLHRIAYRVSLYARSRRAARRSQQALDEAQLPDMSQGAAAEPDFWAVVDEEVERLPSRYRQPFVLCCLEGKTDREAADELGCPRGTVLSRLARARARLRVRLSRRGLTLGATVIAMAGEQSLAATVAPELVALTVQAALGAAGTAATTAASAQVVTLSQGVIRAMLWSKLKTLTAAAALLAVLGGGLGVLGLGLAGQPPQQGSALGRPQPAQAPAADKETKVAAEDAKAKEDAVTLAGRLSMSQNNLKQIVLALHNYNDTFGAFPPPAISSKDGKPLLSWRVAILPFIEQDNLYKQFHLDEPWDSEHNKALLEIVPKIYLPVRNAPKEPGMTFYQAVVGKDAAWEPPNGLKMPSFTDGLSNTVIVAEAAKPVPWTKPEDLPYDADKPLPKFGGLFDGDFNAGFADGSVRLLARDADAAHLRAALTRNQGEVVDLAKIEAANHGLKLGGKIALKDVEEANARLAKELEQLRAEAEKTRQEIETLRSEAERAGRLLESAVKLQSQVEQARQELDELKKMKEELKRRISKDNK
jgi:RNA polymerase sigma factor (sigma-70 family)